jgi:hypothetical protein
LTAQAERIWASSPISADGLLSLSCAIEAHIGKRIAHAIAASDDRLSCPITRRLHGLAEEALGLFGD